MSAGDTTSDLSDVPVGLGPVRTTGGRRRAAISLEDAVSAGTLQPRRTDDAGDAAGAGRASDAAAGAAASTGRSSAPALRVWHGRGLVPGVVEAEVLRSSETVSGWGGIDPALGTIIERRHELQGQCFTGKALVFPGAKGSSGWSSFFQSTRLMGTAPVAMVFTAMTTKAVLGAVVTRIPAVSEFIDGDPVEDLRTGDVIRVDGDAGTVELLRRAEPAG